MKRSWFAAPYAVWSVMFTIVPLVFVCYYAFTTKSGDFTIDNFTKIVQCIPRCLWTASGWRFTARCCAC